MPEKRKLLKFVIVGHVDHGKSTLIGRLLFDTNSLPADKINEIKKDAQGNSDLEFAHLLDHFEEERQQDITIDTTQVFFKTKKTDFVIIDAPGHREFIKNMITGATQAEAGILIVDVKEGIKEQTKRHAYFLSLLGIKQLVVVINKMDLVNYKKEKFMKLKQKIERFLNKIGIKPVSYVPVSCLEGENIVLKSKKMKWYKAEPLVKILDKLKNLPSLLFRPLVFPVQDVFKLDSRRLILGRVEAGILRKQDKLKVLPEGKIATLKSIEKYQKNLDKAITGESIALTFEEPIFIERGNILCHPQKEPKVKNRFLASIIWLAGEEFKKEDMLFIRCATQKTSCRIEKIFKKIDSVDLRIIKERDFKIKPLEVAEVLIQTKNPIVIEPFEKLAVLGRFVLERDEEVCAGGIILEEK